MKQKRVISKRLVHFRQWANKKYAAFNSLHKTIKICTLALAYSIVSEPQQVKAEGADTTQTKITELDEVVVQASMIDLKTAQTGRQVEIIQSAQIQSLPVSSIDDLLRYIPGIEAQTRGAYGAQTDFSLRAANFNQMLVLIDGHKINDPLTGHFNSNIPISPAEIERIEVIYGAASTEYGPDAIGGIINIVTKTFASGQKTKTQIQGKVYTGEHRLIQNDVGFITNQKKWTLGFGSMQNNSIGNLMESGLRNDFNIQTYSGSLAYQFSPKFSIAYRYGYDYRDFNAQWFYTTSIADSAHETVSRQRHQLQFISESEKHKTTISSSYFTTSDNYKFNSRFRAINSTTFGLLRLTHQLKTSENLNILFGIEADQRTIESNNRGNHELIHSAVFLVTSWNATDKLRINPSVRGDYDERNKFYFLPQISTAYQLNNRINLRASVGKSLRTPDFTELYYNNFVATVPANSSVGNPNLSPETAWSYEIGTDLKLSSKLSFSSTLFYRNTSNQIDYFKTNSDDVSYLSNLTPNTFYWIAKNNITVKTLGVDNRIIFYQPFSDNIKTRLIIGYSFNDIDSDIKGESKYTLLRSKHLINSEIQLTLWDLMLSINSTYRVRYNSLSAATINRYLKKSYAIWNASADLNLYQQSIFASMSIYNIFDIKYSDFLGAEMPGRWIAGGVKFNF